MSTTYVILTPGPIHRLQARSLVEACNVAKRSLPMSFDDVLTIERDPRGARVSVTSKSGKLRTGALVMTERRFEQKGRRL